MDTSVDIGVQIQIDERFRGLRIKAEWERCLGKILGRRHTLRSLGQATCGYRVCAQHHEGIKSVSLQRIVGSEGRSEDFDSEFRPLNLHTQQRWYSIARARLTGVTLPAVSLIRIGDEYYVRDGNHRVSVARALGDAAIEAEVVAYDLVPQATAEAQGSVVGAVAVQGVAA